MHFLILNYSAKIYIHYNIIFQINITLKAWYNLSCVEITIKAFCVQSVGYCEFFCE